METLMRTRGEKRRLQKTQNTHPRLQSLHGDEQTEHGRNARQGQIALLPPDLKENRSYWNLPGGASSPGRRENSNLNLKSREMFPRQTPGNGPNDQNGTEESFTGEKKKKKKTVEKDQKNAFSPQTKSEKLPQA